MADFQEAFPRDRSMEAEEKTYNYENPDHGPFQSRFTVGQGSGKFRTKSILTLCKLQTSILSAENARAASWINFQLISLFVRVYLRTLDFLNLHILLGFFVGLFC
jgi:hypothetical protein